VLFGDDLVEIHSRWRGKRQQRFKQQHAIWGNLNESDKELLYQRYLWQNSKGLQLSADLLITEGLKELQISK